MDAQEFRDATQTILQNLDNQGEVSNKLAELVAAFDEEAGARLTAETQAAELSEKNKKLQAHNMELFLRATQPVHSDETKHNENKEESGDAIDRLFTNGGLDWKRSR